MGHSVGNIPTLAECEERDIELIKGLRADLREAGESNIGIIFQQ